MENIFNLKIFDWIDKETIRNILEWCETKEYLKWELILLEWTESNWEWYIIMKWDVIVKVWWQEIATLWIWDIFWEIALLNEEERTATIEAKTDLKVIVITMDKLIEIITQDDNKINKEIMRRIQENIWDTKWSILKDF